jgi:hypothetical protein
LSQRNDISKLNLDDLNLSASDLEVVASVLAILADAIALLAILKAKEEVALEKKKAL